MFLHKKSTKKPAVQPKVTEPPSTQLSAMTNAALTDIEQRCYEELINIVNGIAGALSVSTNSIMNTVALRDMSKNLPTTQCAMMKIPHVTKANFQKYGKALLDITKKYAAEKESKFLFNHAESSFCTLWSNTNVIHFALELMEQEGDIQSAYEESILDLEETDSEGDGSSFYYSNRKRKRGNSSQPKKIQRNNANQSYRCV